ncbi:hypothetical protein Dimus_024995 [Dionaea muscipula]
MFDSHSFNLSMASIFHDIVPLYHRASQATSLPEQEISSIYEATSILTVRDIREMTLAFPSHNYYKYGLPDRGTSVVDYIDRETLCIHLEHFARGLHLPLPTFLIQLLDIHDFLLDQLTPNAISYILAFTVLCGEKAVDATSFLFNTLFSFVEEPGNICYYTVESKSGFKLIHDLPKTPGIWKGKFITVRSWDIPHEHFTLHRFVAPRVRGNNFNQSTRNEWRALDSFYATRLNIPMCHEVVNLDSLEEHLLTSVPYLRSMPAQCFWLYGMTGSRQRLAAVRRLKKKTKTQPEAWGESVEGSGMGLDG